MNELLEKDQVISIVPQNFKNSNKGKVGMIRDTFFTLDMFHKPEEIEPKTIVEFYSPTKNGMLYFNSSIVKVDGDTIVASIPRKHRFLQRRTFTRVKFTQDIELKLNNKTYKTTSLDLSAGGIRLKTTEHIDIDAQYDLCINLIDVNCIKCKYQPIKIEKGDDNIYTLAGRFINLSRADKMKIVQFCIRKDIENKNK